MAEVVIDLMLFNVVDNFVILKLYSEWLDLFKIKVEFVEEME